MKVNDFRCSEGHRLGNVTYKMELPQEDSKRRLVRKLIDDIFWCQQCKKFYKFIVTEVEFVPKKTKEKEGISK